MALKSSSGHPSPPSPGFSPPPSPPRTLGIRLRRKLGIPRASLYSCFAGTVFLLALVAFLTTLFPPEAYHASRTGPGKPFKWTAGQEKSDRTGPKKRPSSDRERSRGGGRSKWRLGKAEDRLIKLHLGQDPHQSYLANKPSESWLGDGDDHLDLGRNLVETRVKASARGFTALENVYLRDGKWWIVSRNESGQIPPLHHVQVGHVPKPGAVDLSPSQIAEHIRMVSPDQAQKVLAGHTNGVVGVVQGLTWVWKENFFLAHYGHMAQELFFGSWRTSTMAWPSPPAPSRLFFTLFNEREWRDSPGLNAFTLTSAFPSLSFLTATDFSHLSNSSLPLVFEKLVMVDRQAAKLAEPNQAANKMVAELGEMMQEKGKKGGGGGEPKWWEPVRRRVVRAVGGEVEAGKKAVLTYISRQNAVHRRLKQEQHDELVRSLKALEQKRGKQNLEVLIVELEGMSPAQQIRLASRTTIFLSLHGNGLSHQLWAPPSPLATTIEILYPGGYARDFQLPASMLGRRHYAFWDDVVLHGKEMDPAMVLPPEFHLHQTPIKATAVVTLLEAILDGRPVPPHRTKL